MTSEDLIAEAGEAAKKLNDINDNLSNTQLKEKELEELQRIMRNIGAIKQRIWDKILKIRGKTEI